MSTKSHAEVLARKHKIQVDALSKICHFWYKHDFDVDFLVISRRKLDEHEKLYNFYDNVARGVE